jgi:hypothetical protein
MRKSIQKAVFGIPLMLILLCVIALGPVSAQDGGTSDSDTTTPTSSGTSRQRQSTHKSTEVTTQSTETETSGTAETELHTKGMNKVAELRKLAKTQQTAEQRAKKCEARKGGLQTKFTSIATNAQRYQDRVDAIYVKTLTYQKTLTTTPANFEALVATADSAKTTSAASVSMLKTAAPNLDCTKPDVATPVATFKVAADDARTKLKAYKMAVKAVVHSLLSANKDAAGSTTAPSTASTDSATSTGGN